MNKIVWLASYPKSGNTWFRTFLANLLSSDERPVNINRIDIGPIASSRWRLDSLLGYSSSDLTDDEIDDLRPELYLRIAAEEDSQRFFKIHDAHTFTSKGASLFPPEITQAVIYLIRNPLDVCVSFAHHSGKVGCQKIIAEMANPNMALAGRSQGHDRQLRQKLLSWSQHVLSWVDAPSHRVHVMRYEDMKLHTAETFGAALRFAGVSYNPARVDKAVYFSRFEELRAQEQQMGFRERIHVGKVFFRKGEIGSWRQTLTPEQAREIVRDHGDVMRRFGYLTENGEIVY